MHACKLSETSYFANHFSLFCIQRHPFTKQNFQGIFYDKRRPHYLNFGSIGIIIGHELTHGFDDRGRQFNGEGNLVDWWEPETKRRYLEKTACIVDQYSNYTAKSVMLFTKLQKRVLR